MTAFSFFAPLARSPKSGETALPVNAEIPIAAVNIKGGTKESFLSAMSTAHSKALPKAPVDIEALAAHETHPAAAKPEEAEPALAASPAPVVTNTLMSAMVQSLPATVEIPKTPPAKEVKPKNQPPSAGTQPKDAPPPSITNSTIALPDPSPSPAPAQPDVSVTGALMAMMAPVPPTPLPPQAPKAKISALINAADDGPVESPKPSAQSDVKPITVAASPLPAIPLPPSKGSGPEVRKLSAATTAALETVPTKKVEVTQSEPVAPSAVPAEPRPVQPSVSVKPPGMNPAENAAIKQQPVVAGQLEIQPVVSNPEGANGGTRGALSPEMMKFGAEKNEIAGGNAQKAPAPATPAAAVVTVTGGSPAISSNASPGKSFSDNSGRKQDSLPSTPAFAVDFSGKSIVANVEAVNSPAASQVVVDHSATQADRLGYLLSQQVLMVRQSGANNLAVSLKLDPQTELSLQLTNHNGQIEAAVTWERGSVTGLDSHWKDLQDSLAKQNVQLLPLENKPAARAASAIPASTTGTFSNSTSQNSQRQAREPREELETATVVGATPSKNKKTTRTTSRQGWESWA